MERNHGKSGSNQSKEPLVVVSADAVIQPLAVVVELVHTPVTLGAMFGLLKAVGLAQVAEQQLVNAVLVEAQMRVKF